MTTSTTGIRDMERLKRIGLIILIIFLSCILLFVGENIHYKNINTINKFDVNLNSIQHNQSIVYSIRLTGFKFIKIYEIQFDSYYYEIFLESISNSKILYKENVNYNISKLSKHIIISDNSRVFFGVYHLSNSIKATTGYLNIIVNKGKTMTTVYFCDIGDGTMG